MRRGCVHDGDLRVCGACGVVTYCSDACAEKHWAQKHHLQCVGAPMRPYNHTVAFLFLAHDGVALPHVWKAYFEYLRNNRVNPVVGIMTNEENVKYDSAFQRKYRLPMNRKTEWCGLSIVKAHFEAMRLMMQQYEFSYLFLVSGTDIPIASVEKLINATEYSTVAFVDKRRYHVAHTQWVQLRRRHAEKLLRYEDRLEEFAIRPEDCPDEYVTGTILLRKIRLNLLGLDQEMIGSRRTDVLNVSRTDMERYASNYPSPIEWRSFDEKQFVAWVEGSKYDPDPRTPDYVRKDLNMILEEDLDKGEFLFFRKVSQLDGEPSNRVRALLPWLLANP